jgi:hypothetical protein
MIKYYDETLREKLDATSSSGYVLNERFVEWEDLVGMMTEAKIYAGEFGYNSEDCNGLFLRAKKHAEEHKKPIESENVLTVVHPLYSHLNHMHDLNSGTRAELNQYFEKLMGFLRGNFDVGVVLLDTLQHYAAATSLLLEQGLVDQVVLTEYGRGTPVDEYELEFLSDKPLFFVGGYNGACLEWAIISARKKTEGKIWAIQDLVVNGHTKYTHSLRPIMIRGVDDEKTITLDDFLVMLDEKEPVDRVEEAMKKDSPVKPLFGPYPRTVMATPFSKSLIPIEGLMRIRGGL